MTRTVLDTLRRLIRINSVNPSNERGQPEAALVSYLADFWREHEIETWKHDVFPGRPNIMARIEGDQPGRRVASLRHTAGRSAIPELVYTMEPPMILAPPVETLADIPLVQGAVGILRAMELDSEPIGVRFTCDTSALSEHGVPCVIFGPGSIDQAHTPGEFVECTQVEQAVDFYQQMMMTDLTARR